QAAGLKLEIEIMYSDVSTDLNHPIDWDHAEPGPTSWQVNGQPPNHATIISKAAACTTTVRQALNNQSTPADIIKLGNEINHGLCWIGSHTTDYYNLLYACAHAAKQFDSSVGVLIHFASIDCTRVPANGIENDVGDVLNATKSPYNIPNPIQVGAFGFSVEPMT